MLPFAAAAANYSNTTLYIVDNGDDGQGFLNDQTTYAYYDGSNYVQVTAEDTIDWSSVSIVYDSNNVLAAGVGGDKNTLRMPEGSNEFHVGGKLEFRNFTDATRAYPNAFGIWRWGISDFGNKLVDIKVDGALKFVDSNFYHGDNNQDWEFKVGISAGSFDLVSNHASDNMYVKFGEGLNSRGLKYLNVANDMTLSGNVKLTMSLNNPSASSYGADYDVNIGGKLKMGSNENNSGTPTMAIGYWGSYVSSGEVQTYFKMSGIDGVGTIQYNNNGVGETCRSYFDIVTKANDTSDFAATIKYNAQNGGTRTNFNVSGAGEQGGVNADGDKQRAQFQIAFCQLLIGDQDPRRFARFADLHDRLLNRGLYFRVLRITGITHIGAQIRRADKHAVDPFHVQNLR